MAEPNRRMINSRQPINVLCGTLWIVRAPLAKRSQRTNLICSSVIAPLPDVRPTEPIVVRARKMCSCFDVIEVKLSGANQTPTILNRECNQQRFGNSNRAGARHFGATCVVFYYLLPPFFHHTFHFDRKRTCLFAVFFMNVMYLEHVIDLRLCCIYAKLCVIVYCIVRHAGLNSVTRVGYRRISTISDADGNKDTFFVQ